MEKDVKILWSSDRHLGWRGYGLARRYKDVLDASDEVTKIAIRGHVDAIIDSGDLLDSTRPSPETMTHVRNMDKALREAGIPMFLISGNHDWTGDRHWSQVVLPDTSDKSASGIILIDGEQAEAKGISIFGLPSMAAEALREIKIPACDILMLHQPVKEFAKFPGNSQMSIADLDLSKHQLVALGDLHINDVRQIDYTYIGYPGSTELISKSESPNKVVKLITFHDGVLSDIVDIPIPTRPVIKADIKTKKELSELIKSLLDEFPVGTRRPIIFVRYDGSNTELNLVPRMNSALDPDDFIIRPEMYHTTAQSVTITQESEILSPQQFLLHAMRPEPAVAGVVTQLMDPTSNADEICDRFIDAKMLI